MSLLHGAPMLAQNPITRLRSTTNEAELNAMRAAAWHRHGVASIVVDDITDPWLRQAITNEANRRWGRRNGGNTMAAKRKDKRPAKPREDLSAPSKWRLQHGDVSAAIRAADPETGTPIMQRRVVDTLGQMLNNGSITREMHEAGCIFRTLFRRAALDSIATSQFLRVAASTGDHLSVSQLDARHRVLNALDVLGGIDSPGGSIAWHVVGLEVSLRAWSAQQGWNGRLVSAPIACGILVAALGTLANHFGLLPRSNAA